jgi:hypothetical protein
MALGCMSASYFGSQAQAELLELLMAHGVNVAHAVLDCGPDVSGSYTQGDLKYVYAIHAVAQWTSAHGIEILFRAVRFSVRLPPGCSDPDDGIDVHRACR